jgi:hypothetical protein
MTIRYVDTLDNLMLTSCNKVYCCATVCTGSMLLYACKHLVWKYSIATDHDPVLCVHVLCFVCLRTAIDRRKMF